jgi:hypothetical protein
MTSQSLLRKTPFNFLVFDDGRMLHLRSGAPYRTANFSPMLLDKQALGIFGTFPPMSG